MNVATALNKKYIDYTIVMLTSLCESNPTPIRCFLLHSELTDEDIRFIQGCLDRYQITIDPLCIDPQRFDSKCPHNVQWSMETYYRLMLPDILPEDVDRLLYLDVDLIVHQSLREMYERDFQGAELLAAQDVHGSRQVPNDFSEKQNQMLLEAFQNGYKYFNAGVILFNMSEIRSRYCFDDYVHAMEDWNYEMSAPDQDILNYVHWRKVGYLEATKYDLFSRYAFRHGWSLEQTRQENAIVHYSGSKPWDVDFFHTDLDLLWWEFAKITPVYDRLATRFLEGIMQDHTVEHEYEKLMNENEQLKNTSQSLIQMMEKFV